MAATLKTASPPKKRVSCGIEAWQRLDPPVPIHSKFDRGLRPRIKLEGPQPVSKLAPRKHYEFSATHELIGPQTGRAAKHPGEMPPERSYVVRIIGILAEIGYALPLSTR